MRPGAGPATAPRRGRGPARVVLAGAPARPCSDQCSIDLFRNRNQALEGQSSTCNLAVYLRRIAIDSVS